MSITSEDSTNYKITQGDQFTWQITCTQPDPNSPDPLNPDYIPLPLTGYTFLLQVKDKPGGKILCATCTLGDGITVVDATNGIISVTISSAKSQLFNYPKSAYQLQRIDQYGDKKTMLQGWFNVNPGVIND